jgi:NAD(P)-dependent dehydrogenase (short-subunit alcohol dehydrogenase family)
MSKQPWALILGASSGFGEAAAIELATAGMNIFGVHLDRRDKLPHVEEIKTRIRAMGREAEFFNCNASDEEMRDDVLEKIVPRLAEPAGTLRVLMHSLAWGSLKPLIGAEQTVSKRQLEITIDTMGNSLVYWVQDCLRLGLLERGARVFAMTSSGGTRAVPNYGPISAAKAVLEAHIRQLALELAPAGITANAILAGVTETSAFRQIPGHEKLAEIARMRNPHHRLTTPEDVAR